MCKPQALAFLEFSSVDSESLIKKIVAGYEKCPQFSPIAEALKSGLDSNSLHKFFRLLDNGLIVHLESNGMVRVCVPESLRQILLEEAHSSRFSSHIGCNKMVKQLTKLYYWKSIVKDISIHCDKCVKCSTMKETTLK